MTDKVQNETKDGYAVVLQRGVKWLCYFPPEFYALALCAGCFRHTGALSPDTAAGMTIVALATTFIRKLY